jgi:hypothetical protein
VIQNPRPLYNSALVICLKIGIKQGYIKEALNDKAMSVLRSLQQPAQPAPAAVDLNTPAGPRRGRPTNAQRAQRHEEFLTLRRHIALLDELIQMKEQIDRLFLKAQNVRGGIYPGLQADIEMEELYPVPETDRQFQDLRDKYTKDLAALQKFLAMKKAVYREDEDSMLGESTALVRLKQARQALSQLGVAEDQLDEIDRRGFLKGMGAAAMLGAAGMANAQYIDSNFSYKHIDTLIGITLWLYYFTRDWEGKESIAQNCLKHINQYLAVDPERKSIVQDLAQRLAKITSETRQQKPDHYELQRNNSLKHVDDINKKWQFVLDKFKSGQKPSVNEESDQAIAEAQTDYQRRRQRERDVDAGKPVARQPKNPQTDYAKKRAKDRRDMELGEKKDRSPGKITKSEDPCWTGYHMVGKKKKNGREVPNCVPGKKG